MYCVEQPFLAFITVVFSLEERAPCGTKAAPPIVGRDAGSVIRETTNVSSIPRPRPISISVMMTFSFSSVRLHFVRKKGATRRLAATSPTLHSYVALIILALHFAGGERVWRFCKACGCELMHLLSKVRTHRPPPSPMPRRMARRSQRAARASSGRLRSCCWRTCKRRWA